MTHANDIKNLIKVKTALAEKYSRLTRLGKSRPCRARNARRSEDYRRQADNLARQLGQATAHSIPDPKG
jgi:hypothetical protein